MAKGYKHAPIDAFYDIGALLFTVCAPGEGGRAQYDNGWNDAEVAKTISERMGTHIPVAAVASFRNRRIGTLMPIKSEKTQEREVRSAAKGLVEEMVKNPELMAMLKSLVASRSADTSPPAA